jgi:hypothetical protein
MVRRFNILSIRVGNSYVRWSLHSLSELLKTFAYFVKQGANRVNAGSGGEMFACNVTCQPKCEGVVENRYQPHKT